MSISAAAHCTQCLRELRQTRLAPPDAGWRASLAWHRTRLGALLTADAELDRRIDAIGSGRSVARPTLHDLSSWSPTRWPRRRRS